MATPWWVNLLALTPFLCFYWWRRGLRLSRWQLLYAAIYAIAFGFVEAVVVVYLRSAMGLLPGFEASLIDAQKHTTELAAQLQLLHRMPASLLRVEAQREAATILMHVGVALVATPFRRERIAMFLWCFAWWDLIYYAGLWLTIRWPESVRSADVLFLIPEPWLAQVWFPIGVSTLMLLAIVWRSRAHSASV
jgi:hypothetical protein